MRDRVLGVGFPFATTASSCSNRRPRLFDWTGDRAKATVDTVVYMDGAILDGLEAEGRKIAWLLESPAVLRVKCPALLDELERVIASFDLVLTCERELCALDPRVLYHPAGSNLPWTPECDYGLHEKDRTCSMLASDKQLVEGHAVRLRYAEKLGPDLDLFGGALGSPRVGGNGSAPGKGEALYRYRFQVAMENCRVPLYYTEKLTDCFATGTVPVYWGSGDIGELFDPAGILVLDEGFDVRALDAGLYDRMLPAVRGNLARVRSLESADDLLYRRYVRPNRSVAAGGGQRWASPVVDGHTGRAARGERLRRDGPPWGRWDLSALDAPARVVRSSDEARLAIVTQRAKKTVDTLDAVPAGRVSVAAIQSRMERPRSVSVDADAQPWFPPLARAFLLRLPDAFVGDQVVFDRARYYRLGRWWLGESWKLYRNAREIRHVDRAVSIGAWGGEAFQHFIADAVPALAGVIDLLESPGFEDVKIVSHRGSPTAEWFWRALGLAHRVVPKPVDARAGFVVHADLVLFHGVDPSLGRLGLHPRHGLRPVQRRLGLLERTPQDVALYLRRDGGRRTVADEARLLSRVEEALAGSGLRLEVFRASGDLAVDRDLVRRARILFGPHGGAFANLVFAQPGSHVIEFLPLYRLYAEGSDPRPLYWGLAQAAGLDYWTVAPQPFDFDGAEMVVDADEVAAIVRRIVRTGGCG